MTRDEEKECDRCDANMALKYCPCLCGDKWYECPICSNISDITPNKPRREGEDE